MRGDFSNPTLSTTIVHIRSMLDKSMITHLQNHGLVCVSPCGHYHRGYDVIRLRIGISEDEPEVRRFSKRTT